MSKNLISNYGVLLDELERHVTQKSDQIRTPQQFKDAAEGMSLDEVVEELAYWREQSVLTPVDGDALVLRDPRNTETPVLKDTGEKTWMDGSYFSIDVQDDVFVHFTLKERADAIIENGRLLMNPPYEKYGTDAVNAISTVWGQYVPGTQHTHIEGRQGELVAVKFTTKTLPTHGYVEEVVWKDDVVFEQAEIISKDDAVKLLNNAAFGIQGSDEVRYKSNSKPTLELSLELFPSM